MLATFYEEEDDKNTSNATANNSFMNETFNLYNTRKYERERERRGREAILC